MADKKKPGKVGDVSGAGAVRAATEQAKLRVVHPPARTLQEVEKKYGASPGNWKPREDGLPDGCPVLPLGKEGGIFHFLDAIKTHRVLKFSDFSINGISSLFAPETHFVQWAWPRRGRVGINGTEIHEAARALMDACAFRGHFTERAKIRGRGCWLDEDSELAGRLIYHAGTGLHVLESGTIQRLPLGFDRDHVYPGLERIFEPWPQRVEAENNPAAALYRQFLRWNWHRQDTGPNGQRRSIDALLLIGWIGAALVAGALHFRPIMFLTGDSNTGKSSLKALIKEIFRRAIHVVDDTSQAGIYQYVKNDSLPVWIDEHESKAEDGGRAGRIIELARIAATGGTMSRGGSDHTSTQFTARSAFGFSAINPPPLPPQDLNRMCILRLMPIENEGGDGSLFHVPINRDTVGPLLLRRMFDQWHRFHETQVAYRAALKRGGHDGRGEDVFGTLLACADLLLADDADALGWQMEDDLSPWSTLLQADTLAEYDDRSAEWRKVVYHLFTSAVPAWRGGMQNSIGQVVEQTVDPKPTHDFAQANVWLNQTGLRLFKPGELHKTSWVLAVPSKHSRLWEVFQGTSWAGSRGIGAWTEALRRAPRDTVMFNTAEDKNKNNIRINGVMARCALLVLDKVM